MKNKLNYVSRICILLCIWCCLVGCSDQRQSADRLPYHPCVEAFTTGHISRYSPIYLIFQQPVDSVAQKQVAQRLSIRPAVKGSFQFENDRTVAFYPATSLDRNTTYEITADLSDWFDLQDADRKFSFRVQTRPTLLRAHLQSMEINPKHPGQYDFTCVLLTPDREEPETVESLLQVSAPVQTQWKHAADGLRHELRLVGVPAQPEEGKPLCLSVAPNKWRVPETELLTIEVPRPGDFRIYDVKYVQEPARYVEVTFTQPLDESQDLRGLAQLQGNQQETVTQEGNRLRLYPDPGRKGEVTLLLSEAIRSADGNPLGEPESRQLLIGEEVPAVRFVGKGVLIPQSDQLSIPFQAVYLRGVVVRVIRILQQNMGYFLQENELDSSSSLTRVGRLVARKTIFLDESGLDLSQWNTFSIDLRRLIEPEPGAVYRVELSFDQRLSAYPCGTTELVTKEQLMAEDAVRFQAESDHYDRGGYYYNVNDEDWSIYRYQEREDPCKPSFYFGKVEARNVLATDIGLIAQSVDDHEMRVLAHHLRTTEPMKGVEVTAYNYQGQSLAQAETDVHGQAVLRCTAGQPFYLMAAWDKQRSYLRVDPGSARSLSLFDVEGEVVQQGLKGFIYGERGVWRPGDTLNIGFMLLDREHRLPANHPVVMELYNPLGQLYARQTCSDNELGLYAFRLATESDAPTGAWNLQATVGGTHFQKRVRIESIKPNRLKIGLSLPKLLVKGEPLNGRLHVEWLQGAKARQLKYELQGLFVATQTHFDSYPNYVFDDPGRSFNSEESKLIQGTTDEEGDASLTARLEVGQAAPGMLLGQLTTRVYEETGDFSLDAMRVLYSPYRRYIGVRSPQQGSEPLATDQSHTFEAVAVDEAGLPQPKSEIQVEIYKVDWYWWWSSDRSQLANFVSDSYNKPVKQMTLFTDQQGRARFDFQVNREEWGSYYVALKDPQGGHRTGVMTYFDWPDLEGRRNQAGESAAQMLTFQTDREEYKPGEEMVVRIPSSEGSRAIVSVEQGSRVLSVQEVACQATETTLHLKATADMQPNVYIHVTLLQPYGQVANDRPIRLYGVVPVRVTAPESHLKPVIQVPKEIRPESNCRVTVSESTGREMAYTLAVVDEGLLDLTRFQTPDPWEAFHAREALGVQTWDLYNYVVGAYGGRIEQLFSIGGDDALKRGPKAIVNRFPPVVRFEGPFRLKRGEKQTHQIQIPNYHGRVRVMVVAGNGEAYGRAEQSVVVRKPVMLLGTLPRVIGTNEEMVVPATVFVTQPHVGEVTVSIQCPKGMEVMGGATRQLQFQAVGDQQVQFRIRTGENPGTGQLVLTATGGSEKARYTADMTIRSISETERQVVPVTLKPGEHWTSSLSMEGWVGTPSVSLEMTHLSPLDLTSRLSYVADYPHGCLEQWVSKAFPWLYVAPLAGWGAEQQAQSEEQVKTVIARLRSFQTANGGFAYWPGQSADHVWGTAYAAHFLVAAEQQGYWIPTGMKQALLNYLRRVSRGWRASEQGTYRPEEESEAYRLFVLAMGESAELGAMNRLKEQGNLTDVSRWFLALAYEAVGQTDIARDLIQQTAEMTVAHRKSDETFGSDLRDRAIQLMAFHRLGLDQPAARVADQISRQLASESWFNTHAVAFALAAMAEFQQAQPQDAQGAFTYRVGTHQGEASPMKGAFWSATWPMQSSMKQPVEVTNTGKSTLYARCIVMGERALGEVEPTADGVRLTATYTDLKGQPLDVAQLQQGTSFRMKLTVQNTSPEAVSHLVLTHILPAGWELLNTRFVAEPSATTEQGTIDYQDIRDDRVYSYINWLPAGRQVTVTLQGCAVYPGRFYLPAATVEAMYDARIRSNTRGRYVEVN